MASQRNLAEHLLRECTEPVRDPLWGHIYLSRPLLSLVDTAPVQQLGGIRQLGPTALVYPGATHTRLNHSLGVLHVAQRMLMGLTRHSNCPPLSREGAQAFLAAALLHDVGHFPYTHSFKTLPLEDHEVLTGQIVQEGELARRLRSHLHVDPAMVAAIVDQSLPDSGSSEIAFYRSLLSGTMDPDKLDYLNRDAYFCGVPYGIQDLDFALDRIIPDELHGIALDESGVPVVENILFSKYLMYRSVYWHRTVRVATAMVRNAVSLALAAQEVQPEDLYGLDDQLLITLAENSRFAPFHLIRRVARRELLKPVASIPFDSSQQCHTSLEDPTWRHTVTEHIAGELRSAGGTPPEPWEVIIDLPDAISFEADISIAGPRGCEPFAGRSVFAPEVVTRFTTQLRMIRLILPDTAAARLDNPREYLEEALCRITPS